MSTLRQIVGIAVLVGVGCGPARAPENQPPPAIAKPTASVQPPKPVAEYTEPAPCEPLTTQAAAPSSPPRQVLQGRHAGRVLNLSVSPEGLLATASEDRSLKLWSLRDRMLLRTFRDARLGYLSSAAWRSDGLLLQTEYRGAVTLDLLGRPDIPEKSRSVVWVERPWGADALPISTYRAGFTQIVLGQTTHQLEVPDKHYPGSMALAPDDSTAATLSGQTLLVWALTGGDTKAVLLPLDAKNGRATGPAVGPRGESILIGQVSSTASLDNPSPSKTLLVSRTAQGLEPRELAGPKQFLSDVAVSPDGRLGVAVSYGELVVFDLPAGEVRWRRTSDRARVGRQGNFAVELGYEKVVFSRDGALLVVTRVGGSVLVFDARNGRLQSELGTEVRRATGAFYTTPDEIAATGDDRLVFWSTKTGRVTRTEEISGEASLLGPDIVVTEADEFGTSCDSGNADWRVERWNGTTPPGPEPEDTDYKDPRRAKWQWPPKDQREERCIPKAPLTFAPGLGLAVTTNDELDIKKQVTYVSKLGTKSRVALPEYAELYAIAPQFSPRGDYVAAMTGSGLGLFNSLIVWNAKTGRIVTRDVQVDGDPPPAGGTQFKGVHRFSFSASGRHIALAYANWVSLRTFPEAKELGRVTLSAKAESMLALDDDGKAWLFGSSDGSLTRVLDGKIAARGKSSDGSILTFSLSPDKKSVVSVSENGSLGLWDLEQATLRATLASFDDGESIAYTPAGAYAGSYEVSDRVGWVFDQPLEGFHFEQFETSFRKPELVTARLAGAPDDVTPPAVRPPRVELLAPPTLDPTAASVSLRVRASASERVDVLRGFVESRPTAAARLCTQSGEATLTLPLVSGQNRVNLVAFDASGFSSNPLSVDVRSSTDAAKTAPELYVVAAGVSQYPKLAPKYQLDAADDDARAIVQAFSDQAGAGKTFSSIHSTLLLDSQVTVESVQAALAQLAQMRPQDLAVVFLAGHGVRREAEGEMVFLTSTAEADAKGLQASGVGWSQLGQALARAKGRVLVLLDACHSGVVSQEVLAPNGSLAAALVRDQRAGALVFAASKGRQFSYEAGGTRGLVLNAAAKKLVGAEATSQGYFTGALLQALRSPDTDRNDDGLLQASELIDDVSARVVSATDGMQTPWVARREMFGDFTVGKAASEARE